MPYEEPEEPQATESADEALLREIREDYRYFCEKWKESRDERKIDMRYISGDPWDPADRKAREDAGRPCINHDELGQYINQSVNNVRANKRGIKVEPDGNGASDATAEFRQNLIRSIEYKSQAQGAYSTAFQAMLEGSYGFIRIGRRYVSNDVDGPDDQEICIDNIPNPDSVLYDPDCKKADWSDARKVFVLDPLRLEDFKAQYPDAKKVDFSEEDRRIAQDWVRDKMVLVAEYWRVHVERIWNTRKTRMVEKKRVVQYITNGVEILEKNEQPGELIPIIPFMGLERWMDEGSGPKRKIASLIRMARDPQMSHAYLCSQEMEEAGLTPKTPYIGYVGQFETDKEAWETATKVPHPFLQVDPIPDSSNGAPLPLPQRQSFTPNFQSYELAKDSTRRAIQAAMGISPLPTPMQRDNQKSGVALERIQQQMAIGSYHFLDKYEMALAFAGRIIDSWIPVVYDAEDREVGIRMPDDTHKVVRANTQQPYIDQTTGEPQHYPIGDETHQVTISTGPSSDSQRDAASDFLDTLIDNLGSLPVAPPQAARLLALAIQMKQLGPKGDEMAEIISPDQQGQQQIPPQLQAAMSQAQQEMQAMHAYAQQKEREVAELKQKLDAHVVDNEYRLKIEQMKIEAQLAMAEVNTKAQNLEERLKFVEDMWRQLHQQQAEQAAQRADQQHQAQMAAMQQEHAVRLQQQQAQAAQDQQAQAAQLQAQQPEQSQQ